MSAFDTKCAWLPCRKQLGVMVYRLSKFSTRQFCCADCAEKWAAVEKRKPEQVSTFSRFSPRPVQLELFPELPRKTVFPIRP